MAMLKSIWIVIISFWYLIRSEIGLFAIGSNYEIRVPNPKAVEGSGAGKLWAHIPFLKHFAGGANGYGASGLINVPIYKYANSTGGGNGQGMSPRNVVAFYYGLSSYMPTVTPATEPLRWLAALIAKWLYWLDIACEVLYTHLFGIMNIGSNNQYFHGTNFAINRGATQGMSLVDWFHDAQVVGLVVCIIMFMCYMISTMIAPSSQTWSRFKNGVYCLFLGTGVICALPALISFATYGANSFATNALGVQQKGLHVNSMANQFFFNNVYSVPHRVLVSGMKPGTPVDSDNYIGNNYVAEATGSNGAQGDRNIHGIMNQPNSYIYDTKGHNSSTSTYGRTIPIPLKIVNLDAMSPAKRNAWNGLENTSITTFLDQYGGSGDVLDKQTLTELQNLNGRSIKKKAERTAVKGASHDFATDWKQDHTIRHGKVVSTGNGKSTSNYHENGQQHYRDTGKKPGFLHWRDAYQHIRNVWNSTPSADPTISGKTVKVYNVTKPNNSGDTVSVYKSAKNPNRQELVTTQNKRKTYYLHKGKMPKMPNKQAMTSQKPVTVTKSVPAPNNSGNTVKANTPKTKSAKKQFNKDANNYGKKQAKSRNIASNAGQNAQLKNTDLANIFEYHLSGIGPNAYLNKLTAFQGGSRDLTAGLNHSYAMYKVSWANIYLGLIVLLVVFIAFIFKLLDAFFEAAVMYAVMDIMVARDMNDPRKMRQWFRNFFNLWAMLIIDVFIIRIFFIAYFTVNNAVRMIFLDYMPRQIGGNMMVLGMLQAICDIGLLMKCLEGNQAVNEALGRPTGASNGWGHALAFMGAARAVRGGFNAVSNAGVLGKGAWNATTGATRGVGNFAKKAGQSVFGKFTKSPKSSHKGGVSNGKAFHKNGTKSKARGLGLGVNNATANGNNSTGGIKSSPSTASDDNSTANNAGDMNDLASQMDNTQNQNPTSDDNSNNTNDQGIELNPNASQQNKKPKKPSNKGDNFGNTMARKMAQAKRDAGKQNNVKMTGSNNATTNADASKSPSGLGGNNSKKPNNNKPLTAGQRATAKEQNLRSKAHPITAIGDRFFNGVTHVGNAGQELFGGQGTPVNHSTDAAFGNPGHLDNPDTEDDAVGTGDDSSDDGKGDIDTSATQPDTSSDDNNEDDNTEDDEPTTNPTQPLSPNDTGNMSSTNLTNNNTADSTAHKTVTKHTLADDISRIDKKFHTHKPHSKYNL